MFLQKTENNFQITMDFTPELQTLITQVRDNCRIASAGQAGHFSLCGLVLRLRQLYKWEHHLPPWREPDPQVALDWVEDQERLWEGLEDRTWQTLALDGAALDPFGVEALNESLIPQGLAYGAGLSRGLAPTCFLGELQEVRRQGEVTILVLDRELARDLDGTPALCQGNLIYARKQALAFFAWDRLSDPMQQNNRYLKIALDAYGLSLEALLENPPNHQEALADFLDRELEAVIRHEVGEALEPSLKEAFPAILSLFPQTRVELWIRGLKDVLAEVNEWGRLAYIIENRALPSLALMLAWRPGLYSLLLPELEPAFHRVAARGDWQALEEARKQALARLRRTAAGLTDLLDGREAATAPITLKEIEQQYLAPLGL